MKNKHIAILYFVAFATSLFNASIAYGEGNANAAMAWLTASGFSAGAAGAYLKLAEEED